MFMKFKKNVSCFEPFDLKFIAYFYTVWHPNKTWIELSDKN